MARGRKLYYDVTLTGESPSVVVPLTQVTAGTPPDRQGAYLDALPGLPATASGPERQRQEVTAIFVPYGGGGALVWVDSMPVPDIRSNGFSGPITLLLNTNINPASVVLGATIIFGGTLAATFETYFLEVIDNTIVIHNNQDTPPAADSWFPGAGTWTVELTAGILGTDGAPLSNPQTQTWEWITD